MYETGHFATLWKKLAEKLSLSTEFLGDSWRHGADPAAIGARLARDSAHQNKAVCVVHNETSTGTVTDVAAVRRAIDAAGHPALLLVDTISGLGSIEYRHDEWGVDVTISGSQKGMMLPPGLSFNAVSEKALAAARQARLPKAYWGWDDIIESNKNGFWPSTPATNLLYGLSEACDMLLEETLPVVFARHQRLAEATREAVRGWGMEILCEKPAEYSNVLTAIMMPKDAAGKSYNADAFRKIVLKHFNMSLGQGLGRVAGTVFRIGHLGDFNELTLMGTLAGVEMGFALAGVPHQKGGVLAAMRYLTATAGVESRMAQAA